MKAGPPGALHRLGTSIVIAPKTHKFACLFIVIVTGWSSKSWLSQGALHRLGADIVIVDLGVNSHAYKNDMEVMKYTVGVWDSWVGGTGSTGAAH